MESVLIGNRPVRLVNHRSILGARNHLASFGGARLHNSKMRVGPVSRKVKRASNVDGQLATIFQMAPLSTNCLSFLAHSIRESFLPDPGLN